MGEYESNRLWELLEALNHPEDILVLTEIYRLFPEDCKPYLEDVLEDIGKCLATKDSKEIEKAFESLVVDTLIQIIKDEPYNLLDSESFKTLFEYTDSLWIYLYLDAEGILSEDVFDYFF